MKKSTDKQAKRTESALNQLQAYKFKHESCTDKRDAERNLIGRTHYVDADTLKYFNARILRGWMPGKENHKGFTYALIESLKKPGEEPNKTRRAVLFDCFGTVIFQSEFYRTTEQAEKALNAFLEEFDLFAHYSKEIKARAKRLKTEATRAMRALNGKDIY